MQLTLIAQQYCWQVLTCLTNDCLIVIIIQIYCKCNLCLDLNQSHRHYLLCLQLRMVRSDQLCLYHKSGLLTGTIAPFVSIALYNKLNFCLNKVALLLTYLWIFSILMMMTCRDCVAAHLLHLVMQLTSFVSSTFSSLLSILCSFFKLSFLLSCYSLIAPHRKDYYHQHQHQYALHAYGDDEYDDVLVNEK